MQAATWVAYHRGDSSAAAGGEQMAAAVDQSAAGGEPMAAAVCQTAAKDGREHC
jgi:hypothetical protein